MAETLDKSPKLSHLKNTKTILSGLKKRRVNAPLPIVSRETIANDSQQPDYQFASANDNLQPAPIENTDGGATAINGTDKQVNPVLAPKKAGDNPTVISSLLNTIGIEPESQEKLGEVFSRIGDNFKEEAGFVGSLLGGTSPANLPNIAQNTGAIVEKYSNPIQTLKTVNNVVEATMLPIEAGNILSEQNPLTDYMAKNVNKVFEAYDNLQNETYKLERNGQEPPEQLKELNAEFDKLRKNVEMIMLGEAVGGAFKRKMKPLSDKMGITDPNKIVANDGNMYSQKTIEKFANEYEIKAGKIEEALLKKTNTKTGEPLTPEQVIELKTALPEFERQAKEYKELLPKEEVKTAENETVKPVEEIKPIETTVIEPDKNIISEKIGEQLDEYDLTPEQLKEVNELVKDVEVPKVGKEVIANELQKPIVETPIEQPVNFQKEITVPDRLFEKTGTKQRDLLNELYAKGEISYNRELDQFQRGALSLKNAKELLKGTDTLIENKIKNVKRDIDRLRIMRENSGLKGELPADSPLLKKLTKLQDEKKFLDSEKIDFNIKPESYQQAIKNIKDRGTQINSNPFDPTVFKDIYTVGKYHIEQGLTKFSDWARQTVKDLGDWVKPHLRKIFDEVTKNRTGLKDVKQNLFGGINAEGFIKAKEQGKTFEGRYDKKERFEIDDSKAKLLSEDLNPERRKSEYTKEELAEQIKLDDKFIEGKTTERERQRLDELLEKRQKVSEEKRNPIRLSEVLDYPELFDNYPQLKNTKVKIDSGIQPKDMKFAEYDAGLNQIRVSPEAIKSGEAKSYLLHEIQHKLQEIENFAYGGDAGNLPKAKYLNQAGEIEARDVQARMNLTAEERAKTEPYSSENIKPEDAIVNYDFGTASLEGKKKKTYAELLENLKTKKLISEEQYNVLNDKYKKDTANIEVGEKKGSTAMNEKTLNEELQEVGKRFAEDNPEMIAEAKRQRITSKQMIENAKQKAQYLTDVDIERLKPGDIVNTEEAMSLAMYQQAKILKTLKNKELTDLQRAELVSKEFKDYIKVNAIYSEGARLTGSKRFLPDLPLEDLKSYAELLKDTDSDLYKALLPELEKLNVEQNPTIKDKITSVIYELMLSRPTTHARNIIGNSVHLAYELGTQAVNPMNVPKIARGLKNGLVDFKRKGLPDILSGKDKSTVKFIDFRQVSPKSNWLRNILPTTWLKIEDTFFKSLAKGVETEFQKKILSKELKETLPQTEANIKKIMDGEILETPEKTARYLQSLEEINKFADYITFQTELGKTGKTFSNWQATTGLGTASKLLIPFVKTPSNILKAGLQPFKVLKLLSKDYRQKYLEMSAREKSQFNRRIVAGSIFYSTIASLVLNETIQVTGNGAIDKSKKDYLEKLGYKPNHIYIGDTGFSYQNLPPFSQLFAMLGNYSDGLKYNVKPKDDELNPMEKITKSLAGFVATTTEQSMLQGVSNLFKWISTGNPRYWENFATLPLPAILSTYKDFQTYFKGDNTDYETNNFTERVQKRVGIYDDLKAKLNVFGDEKKTIYETLPIPSKLNTNDDNTRLERFLLTNNINIGYPSENILKANGETITKEEYREYLKKTGQELKKSLLNGKVTKEGKQINSFDYLNTLPIDEADKEIKKLKNDIRDDIREDMFGKKQNKGKKYNYQLKPVK